MNSRDNTEYADHLESLQGRFSAALAASGHDAALVYSGPVLPAFRDDQSYPFRPQAWFSIWGPLDPAPDCFVYVKPGSRPLLLICSPPDFWYQPATLATGDWTRQFTIKQVPSLAEARAALPQNLSRVAFLGEPGAPMAGWGLGAINPEKLLLALDFTRAVKTPYELSMLRLANRLAARGHLAAAAAFAARESEYRIHQAFLAAIGQREQELPYNAIVALNEAGSVLHYQNLRREPPAAHHSLLIDAGAQWAGYASDITRTFAAADDFRGTPGVRRPHQGHGPGPAVALRAGPGGRGVDGHSYGRASGRGGGAARLWPDQLRRRRSGRQRPLRRVPATWHRPPAGPAGTRRGWPAARRDGRRDRAAGRASLPAPDAASGSRLCRHHGAGPVLHRAAAGAGARAMPAAPTSTGAGWKTCAALAASASRTIWRSPRQAART